MKVLSSRQELKKRQDHTLTPLPSFPPSSVPSSLFNSDVEKAPFPSFPNDDLGELPSRPPSVLPSVPLSSTARSQATGAGEGEEEEEEDLGMCVRKGKQKVEDSSVEKNLIHTSSLSLPPSLPP